MYTQRGFADTTKIVKVIYLHIHSFLTILRYLSETCYVSGIVRYHRHNSQQDSYNDCSYGIYKLYLLACLASMYHVLGTIQEIMEDSKMNKK